jgi:hypothetical protein
VADVATREVWSYQEPPHPLSRATVNLVALGEVQYGRGSFRLAIRWAETGDVMAVVDLPVEAVEGLAVAIVDATGQPTL